MGILVENNEKRSALQERVAAELREKAARNSAEFEAKHPDGVDDSAYVHDYEKSRPVPRIVMVIIVAVVLLGLAALVMVLASSS